MKNALNIAVTLSLTMSSFVPGSPIIKDWPNELRSNLLGDQGDKTRTNSIVDGITANWAQDVATQKGGEIVEVKDGWLHLVSSSKNGNAANNASSYPATFVNPAEFDFTQPGFFTTTMKTKQNGALNRFGFYLGYKDPGNGMFIGYDTSGWFWQKYTEGSGAWYGGTRVPSPAKDTEVKVRIEWNENKKIKFIVDNQTVFEDLDFTGLTFTNKIALKAGHFLGTAGSELTDVYLKDMDYTGLNSSTAIKYSVSGKILDEKKVPVADAKVTIGDHVVRSGDDGAYTFDSNFITGDYTLKVAKSGFKAYEAPITVAEENLVIGDITLTKETINTDQIASADMRVELYQDFPAVRKYEMTKLGNKVMYGQTNNLDTIQINGTNVKLKKEDVTYKKVSDTKATYVMHVKDESKNIDANITAEMIVDENKLHFNITKIDNNLDGNKFPVQKLAIPDHSLVAVHSNEAGASFTGAVMSSDTNKNGDVTFPVNDQLGINNKNNDYMYAFVSNNELSASMWSNSENEGRVIAAPVSGGSHNTRIIATTSESEDYKSVGLASAPWYYHRVVEDSKGKSYQVPETDMPKMSIVITADENADKKVNWQDGAIAFRDIMNNPFKSEEVPELVAWRIAMNFGGQAQNPFLTTLDNVKKVALHTDGLGQSILLKGYGSEGHDSGHPDYGDIGKRIGGAKDMNTMMEKGKAYGARFGVHVNASEMYPEAKAFSEEMVRRKKSGDLRYGWNWLDQGIGIDGVYDLASGAREDRFAQLKEQVGDNMDFIYLDVWGNQTASDEDSWETRKISKTIIDNDWRMTTEWGSGNEYDSTFQHWATDLTYGGSTAKGENSQVMRFLRNHQKDSWVGDYPSYGGAAIAPLLGGYNMKDFEGWQGRNDYDEYIRNLYTHDVSTKFIQHFKVQKWLNNPLDATAPKDATVNNGNEEITLADDAGNTLVIRRASNDNTNAEYRNRTMVLNGKVVSKGKVSKGDGKGKGDESYLLPWNWNADTGAFVASEDEKLYHWNTAGGTTTWDIPQSWNALGSVKVYKLTDLGKEDEKVVPVVNGQITLEATAETPYVICKGSEAQIDVTWSEGMHVNDAGFNGGQGSLDQHWKKDGNGTASISKSQFSNPMLKLSGEISTTQTLTDLKAGQSYAMYVGVDNRSDTNAGAVISSKGKVISENYTGTSIAKNYILAYTHNNNSATVDGSSYFQNMYVFFTAPKDGSPVELTLSHTGSGDTYFDDIRIVENESENIVLDKEGKLKEFNNDFENNAQGIYPFVVGATEGVQDNRVHLSELHAPYTQAGWDVKKMDDVLNGNWSIKANGLTQRGNIVFQTIPQNVKFEPGVKYKVSFNYQTGSDDTYALATGNGEFNASTAEITPLKKALGTTDKHEFKLVGGLNGDSWFGIYSTNVAPDTQGTVDQVSQFGGYLDFVLDDVKIERVDESFAKEDAIEKLNEVMNKYAQKDFNSEAWKTYQDILVQAQVMIHKDNATAEDYSRAYLLIRSLDEFMKTAPGTETEVKYDVEKDQYTVSAGSAQPGAGKEGPAILAQDGDVSSHWHTKWNDTNLNNAWYQFNLNEPTTIDGLRYLPRSEGVNGKIKDYTVLVTLEDGTTKEIKGTFVTATTWQKVSFDAVENVVSVRLKAETSAGSATQMDMFATAAELRLTTPKDVDEVQPVDKTALEGLIATADQLNAKDYEAKSWKNFEEKLEIAKTVINKGVQKNAKASEATAYEVALAYENLKNAMDALVPAVVKPEVDKTKLNTAIQNAEAKNKDLYTKESVDVMNVALEQAKAVAKNVDATQKQVDDATTALTKAMDELKFKENVVVDKNELMRKITAAMQLDKNSYTVESYQALASAIAKAQSVIADENATNDDVKQAYDALVKAIDGLVVVVTEDPSKPGKPSEPGKPSKPGTGTGNVDTGDSTNMGVFLPIAILSGGAVVYLVNKKRKEAREVK